MKNKLSKAHFKRRLRANRRKLSGVGQQINKDIDRHIFRRWSNLVYARRFLIGWVSLLLILIFGVIIQTTALSSHYLEPKPVAGGILTEGMVGSLTNGNPIYATDSVDKSVAKLVFSSLLTYDDQGNLVGDLAKSWDMGPNARVFTVKLKNNLKWHDGQPVSADDVVFTYTTIQNPAAKSPLSSTWKGVKVEKVDATTVKFTSPSPFVPFPNLLTDGIVPKHILGNKDVAGLRSDSFNTNELIGSGPFKYAGSEMVGENQEIKLVKNNQYYRSEVKLDGFSIKTFPSQDDLKKALDSKKVDSAGGFKLKDNEIFTDYKYPFVFNSATMFFLKTTAPNLTDTKVRQALVRATNVNEINKTLGYQAVQVKEPILNDQTGYNSEYWQLAYNRAEAAKLLDEAGWKMPENGKYRMKDGKELSLKLVSENNEIYPAIATELQRQWASIGVKLDVSFVTADQITQTYIPNHEYDVFLYGINIGSDPDVYAYWHSSQAAAGSSRLNLSEYKSSTSDLALESGRSRSKEDLRAAKYKSFLTSWKNDAPAIGLYQPRYLYLSNKPIYQIVESRRLNNPEDRFNNVNNWMVKTTYQQKD
jgi:peptide/nickel transport system substrate-binding protein